MRHREANQLVEEFMLLANISVAQTITAAFPNCALLRCHPSPNARKLAAAASAAKDAVCLSRRRSFSSLPSHNRIRHVCADCAPHLLQAGRRVVLCTQL